jgi:hypothetical protein
MESKMASFKKSKPNPVFSPAPVPAKVPAPAAPVPAPIVSERSELKGSGKPKAPAVTARIISHDDIARRAYEIYASRGYAASDPDADWHEAERQLRAGL